MLKHRPTDRSHTCRPPYVFSDWTDQTVQEVTESNGYRGTGPGELFGSVNERSFHHRVVSGKFHESRCSNTGHPATPTRVARQMRSRIRRTRRFRKRTKSNGYRGTGPGEHVRSVNERSSYHRVVSGQLHDAETSTLRPRKSVKKLRKSFCYPIDAHTVASIGSRELYSSCFRALASKFAPHAFPIHCT